MVFRLHKNDLSFPDPALAEEDGLLAVGGDLSVERLLAAYHRGIFPWYSEEPPILWYSPHKRFVLFPDKLKTSKSMKRILNSGRFKITFNTAFKQVINACSQIRRKDQDGTWITNDMRKAYINLHHTGYAQSVEAWEGDELVGGLYGVVINQVFCGESMFSKVSNASKTALIWLIRNQQFSIIDCQVYTKHLASLGAEHISGLEYLKILRSI